MRGFRADILQHRMLQHHVGIESLQLSVLAPQFIKPFNVGRPPPLLVSPRIVGGGTDVVDAPGLVDGSSGLGLFED